MPVTLREATIAIEDENFEDHSGVDIEAIVRAAVSNAAAGGTVQGGSTITQQLARTLYIKDPERNIERKLVEAKIALELEDRHTKEWILRQYLNSVPYGTVNGRTALGVEAAAETFFAKKAKDLTLAESAMLAGLPQAPSQYNPFLNPGAAQARRDQVLNAMEANGLATPQEVADAKAEGLGVKSTDKFTEKREGYFFDYVQQVLIDQYGVADSPPGRAEGLHDDRPRPPGSGPDRHQQPRDAADRSQLGGGGDRAQHRRDQGDGLERHLWRARLQPRRAGPPPARVRLQDDGPDGRRARGHRPQDDLLPVALADLDRYRRGRAVGGQDLRRQLGGQRLAREGDPSVRQHRLRAADQRHRPGEGQGDRPAARDHLQARTATTPRGSEASRWASPRSRWPPRTRRWPTAACAARRTRSSGSSSRTAAPRTSARTRASAS